jgi:acyl carrier protein
MTRDEIKNRVTAVFRDVLDNQSIVLHDETAAKDIEGWDSLTHISLIYAVEKEFDIRFDLLEIKPLKNAGELLDLIEAKSP